MNMNCFFTCFRMDFNEPLSVLFANENNLVAAFNYFSLERCKPLAINMRIGFQ